ncbi:TetR/AcrR family transcriptional regulator [Ktedonospora formicarum]|uniref:TetR family transcriptional regulator n=1 Tax=Ktedonospora formicarum TaxID=2778364 RepID=A0A8J3MU52_9CHLR|nr:TetR/AcrR family transcriptional regulator [Ktedonospora formicarum]GHO48927.1 TetR family transcriptional regulator [Ktedonospora formicarum]
MFEEGTIPKGEKREAILEAALKLIAEQGLQHTPMSLISRHARVSAGGIYHHFESKEDLLQTLYQRIMQEMISAIVGADDPSQPLAKRFQTLWLSMFRYGLAHRQELVFLEQYESVPIHTEEACNDALGEEQTLNRLIVDLRAQELIKDLPLVIISELTYGMALKLAKQVHAGQVRLDDATLAEIAKACWDAIAR